jgi:hypothetical protein
VWCFAVPPVLAALSVLLQRSTHEGDPTASPPPALKASPGHL